MVSFSFLKSLKVCGLELFVFTILYPFGNYPQDGYSILEIM